MGDGDGRLLLAPAGGQAMVLRAELGGAGATGRLGRLDEGGAQVAVALAGLAALPFPGALVVPWCQPDPGGQVRGAREACGLSIIPAFRLLWASRGGYQTVAPEPPCGVTNDVV